MATALKDIYTHSFFEGLSQRVHNQYTGFDKQQFLTDVFDQNWEQLELKARMRHIALMLNKALPLPYDKQLEVLEGSMIEGQALEQMFFPDFVEVFGMEHRNRSLLALYRMTPYASAEFAIRPFIIQNAEATFEVLNEWATDENHHVRRLASEGCRPRLPWAIALKALQHNPAPVLPILEKLKNDPSEYVRRSVANNLNDISKDHPDLVLDLAEQWKGVSHETERLLKHACRTLLKKGNRRTMMRFGFSDPVKVKVEHLNLSHPQIKIGEQLTLDFNIVTQEKAIEKLRIEYAIAFLKANGQHHKKVFFIGEKIPVNGSLNIKKRHSFEQRTTRKHYPGTHHLYIIVNGMEKATQTFELI